MSTPDFDFSPTGIATKLAATAIEKSVDCFINKVIESSVIDFRKKKLHSFFEDLYRDGITNAKIEKFLEDEKQQELFVKAIDSTVKSSSKISRTAIARIVADQASYQYRYKPYHASRAVDSLRDLDDVDCLTIILAIEAAKNTDSRFKADVSKRPISQSVTISIEWNTLLKYKEFLPGMVTTEHDLSEVVDSLIQRNLLKRPFGTLDSIGTDLLLGEFTLLVLDDLRFAADRLGFNIPAASL